MSDEARQEIARAEVDAHDAGYWSGYQDGYSAGLVDGSEAATEDHNDMPAVAPTGATP